MGGLGVIGAGEFRQRATFRAPATGRNAMGGRSAAYSDRFTVRVRARERGGGESPAAGGAVASTVMAEIVARRNSNTDQIRAGWQVDVLGPPRRRYNIRAVAAYEPTRPGQPFETAGALAREYVVLRAEQEIGG